MHRCTKQKPDNKSDPLSAREMSREFRDELHGDKKQGNEHTERRDKSDP